MLLVLQKSFTRMEKARLALLQATEGLSEAQLHHQPGADQWSVVQVVEHLIAVESGVLRVVQKQLSKSALRSSGFSAQARFILLALLLRYKKKFKAPAMLPEPTGEQSFEEYKQHWTASRAQWQQLLEQVPAAFLQKEIFKHPVVGFLTLEQTVNFITEHCNHHIAQIQRLIRTVEENQALLE